MANKKCNIPVPRSHPDYMQYYKQIREEELADIGRNWAEKNKEKKRKQWREWYYRNPKTHLANCKVYKTQKINAMPSWVDKDEIKSFYENCPEGYHVDHIVPLRGKTVCGLHIIENLQYLPALENMQKSNSIT